MSRDYDRDVTRSVVRLPPQVQRPFQVYVSGVPQREGEDFLVEGRTLVFPGRVLKKDRISGWRWFVGFWGVGTYRQDDSVDVRYVHGGSARVAEGLPIEAEEV
jgi:hypothetical protein